MKLNHFSISGLVTATILILIAAISLNAQTNDPKDKYSPVVGGYIRAWHQTDFSNGQGQFIMREMTFGISGDINEYFSYKFLADVTRLGKFSTTSTSIDGTTVLTGASASFTDILLDAMVKITPVKNLSFSGGQFKIPFSTDNLRGNNSIDFVNRPLMTNIAPASRDIGALASYKISGQLPIELNAGAFNGSGLNKTETDKTTNYVCRTVISPLSNLNLSANYYSGRIASNETDIIGFGFDWKVDNFFIDAEYVARDTRQPLSTIKSNSLFIYSYYNFLISEQCFLKYITPAVRYETYEPNSDKNDDEINRLTAGLTFNFAKLTWAHIRLNYEKFDYKDGRDNPDKLILEMQARF